MQGIRFFPTSPALMLKFMAGGAAPGAAEGAASMGGGGAGAQVSASPSPWFSHRPVASLKTMEGLESSGRCT